MEGREGSGRIAPEEMFQHVAAGVTRCPCANVVELAIDAYAVLDAGIGSLFSGHSRGILSSRGVTEEHLLAGRHLPGEGAFTPSAFICAATAFPARVAGGLSYQPLGSAV